ncbi:glycosyltransferase family 4 protein [Roseomonas frigidaquae]|uniref:Glycosyltransferase family 4 protein n=1 Tax=Falsiroseomonas frigidaquae TaxID=487318 RepID=A0ABX1ESZ8_9PROT|nr:glycosyltransferase [Falsiroseomonas frigidaquae]NKE43212.1 glycosyltransferase family 4 protein [Falsiroseomonas frigidaquae]
MDGVRRSEGAGVLGEADRRRDARDWRGAAEGYAAWLAQHPDDWGIWVQHGHCLKEQGDPLAAVASYRQAERGLAEDADLQIQIGHALKRAGDRAGARAAYARALDLTPDSDLAWREVATLLAEGGLAEAAAEEGAGLTLLGDLSVVFDLSDLLSWFGGNRAPSGIQRVQMEIVGPALRPGGAASTVLLAVFDAEAGLWRALPREIFLRLASLARAGADPLDPAWREAVGLAREAVAAAPELVFPQGAWLVNLGSSWWLRDYNLALRAAKARHGLRYAALVHDCGPLVVPEHNAPAMVAEFARWFAGLGAHADLLLAVSEATRKDIEALRAKLLPGLPAPPVSVLRLDAQPVRVPPAPRPHPGIAALAGRPYALFVGTLESRKNHLFVLNAWLALTRKHGAAALPLLVLVGRPGYLSDPALALLRNAPALRDGVRLLVDVPDSALAGLYEGALFTLYNSFHEGWGLPVTEALSHGKAVLAPDHSGLLEAGLGLALHFRHQSEPDFLEAVERLTFDAAYRHAQESKVRAGLQLRAWKQVTEDLLGRLSADAPAEGPPGPASPLAPPLGTLHRLAEIAAPLPSPEMALADLLRAGEGWHGAEEWGCWTRPGRALLRLPLPASAEGVLRLHLMLRGPARAQRVTLAMPGSGPGAEPLVMELAADSRAVAALEVPAGAGRVLELAIEADAAPESADPAAREVGVGVVSVMACAAQDLAARLAYLERQRFIWPEPV